MMILFALFILGRVYTKDCPSFVVRKEVSDVTPDEWDIYKDTIQKATNIMDPVTGVSIWETHGLVHAMMNPQIHGTCMFLYYHRYFTKWAEDRLRKINPRFSFFYFDHSRVYNKVYESVIWDHLGKHSYLKPISSGVLGNITLDYTKSFLTRASNYDSIEPLDSIESWNKLFEDSIKTNDIQKWFEAVQYNHGNFHCNIGGCANPRGLLGTMWSPLDPLFFAHHGFIDFIWLQAQAGWAKANVDPRLQFGGKHKNWGTCEADTPLPFFHDILLKDVLDSSDICVKYALFQGSQGLSRQIKKRDISVGLASTILEQIRSYTGSVPQGYIPSNYERVTKAPPPLSKSWIDMNFKHQNVSDLMEYVDDVNARIIQDTLNYVELKVIPLFTDIVNVARPYVGIVEAPVKQVVLKKLDDLSSSDVVNAIRGLF